MLPGGARSLVALVASLMEAPMPPALAQYRGTEPQALVQRGMELFKRGRVAESIADFDRVIASPDMMGLVGKAARVLGPRGLMPNPKLGTLTTDVVGAIEAAKKGQAVYRADKFGIIHCGFGKVDFETEKLLENLKALMLAVHEQKPKTMKGKFYEHATISSTMGPACKVDTKNLDPTSSLFFREI